MNRSRELKFIPGTVRFSCSSFSATFDPDSTQPHGHVESGELEEHVPKHARGCLLKLYSASPKLAGSDIGL